MSVKNAFFKTKIMYCYQLSITVKKDHCKLGILQNFLAYSKVFLIKYEAFSGQSAISYKKPGEYYVNKLV